MKTILITVVLAACAALEGTAMPTKEETERAVPVVRKLLEPEWAAHKSGKRSRAEVAATAMKLADEADTDAAKLLLMKGAFVLYVKDGNLEKAVKTMNTLEKTISDLPPQCVTNMIELALLGVSKKEVGARLYRLLDERRCKVKAATREPAQGNGIKTENVGGYTWSYVVQGGEATIVLSTNGKWYSYRCAVSPRPMGALEIPSSLGGVKVTGIGKSALSGCNGLTEVTIPASVTNIGWGAFRGNGALRSFSVDPANRFYSAKNGLLCSKDGMTIIAGVNGDVVIPPGITRIEYDAFSCCSGLTSLIIPASVMRIGRAFCSCSALKEIRVSEDNQFYKSENGLLLTKDGKTLIWGTGEKVMIPMGVTCIADGAFSGCKGLVAVTIPSSVNRIESHAFQGCGGLTSVTIPSSVKALGQAAFGGCDELKAVTIGSGVSRLEVCVFSGCRSLKSVTIPANVTSIESCAFSSCDGLGTIIMCGERPSIQEKVFNACENLSVIHVPANVKSWAGMKEWQGIPLVFDAKLQVAKDRTTVQSIIDGMIKVPGRDYWLSETELTQGQWEAVMGYNLSKHKGANLPADCVSRNDCDVFLEKLNQTKEAQSSQFVFALPTHAEWAYAAQAGGEGNDCWIKPGVVGKILDMAWMKENSSNQTHAVAKKVPNAFGFYDMVGNVYEWMSGYDEEGHGCVRGGRYVDEADKVSFGVWIWFSDLSMRGGGDLGMRLAAHLRSKGSKRLETQRAVERQAQAEAEKAQREAERDEQRRQLQAIQEELKRARTEKAAAEGKGIKPTSGPISAAQKLQTCDFLLNKDFKKNAKYYLCLFSASWCGPCRREMPRIAKTYAETLKADPNIELIHFSCDQNDEKALAWAKEHDVKFPVVKPKGGNPLNLQSRGIPHLFIVKADGTLVEEGHPAKLFTEEKLRELK